MLIRFQPIYQQRVWGGRELASGFGRPLPADGMPYGESWEVVDRPEAQSVVASGPWAGKTLHELWTEHRGEIFGDQAPDSERFPLLLKILDARDVLSLQVHPPAHQAEDLGGEPKTEMWVIAQADPGAKIYAGVTPGTTAENFATALAAETVAACVPSLEVRRGDFIFIPSGRLHAIGAGLVIFEIQQNSDTTYRVYDWGRKGLDGKPRELHVPQSLASIDFTDVEPTLGQVDGNLLVKCDHFQVSQHRIAPGEAISLSGASLGRFLIVVEGTGMLDGEPLVPGDHVLLTPQAAETVAQAGTSQLWLLQVEFP